MDIDKKEILTKEYYELLKSGKNFQVKNGRVLDLEADYASNINWDNEVTIYSHKEKGVVIQNNLSYFAITYEDFNKGYDHIMDIIKF